MTQTVQTNNEGKRAIGKHYGILFLPVQMKNLDSPTLSSTLFKDMDTCRAAVKEATNCQRETY